MLSRGVNKIVVKLIEARNLKASVIGGTSDPYCRLQLQSRVPTTANIQKSQIIKKNLSPRWDQEFTFLCPQPENDLLHIEIYDHDRIGRDDPLGKVFFAVATVERIGFIDTWLDVRDSKNINKFSRGQLHIAVTYIGKKGPGPEPTRSDYHQQQYHIKPMQPAPGYYPQGYQNAHRHHQQQPPQPHLQLQLQRKNAHRFSQFPYRDDFYDQPQPQPQQQQQSTLFPQCRQKPNQYSIQQYQQPSSPPPQQQIQFQQQPQQPHQQQQAIVQGQVQYVQQQPQPQQQTQQIVQMVQQLAQPAPQVVQVVPQQGVVQVVQQPVQMVLQQPQQQPQPQQIQIIQQPPQTTSQVVQVIPQQQAQTQQPQYQIVQVIPQQQQQQIQQPQFQTIQVVPQQQVQQPQLQTIQVVTQQQQLQQPQFQTIQIVPQHQIQQPQFQTIQVVPQQQQQQQLQTIQVVTQQQQQVPQQLQQAQDVQQQQIRVITTQQVPQVNRGISPPGTVTTMSPQQCQMQGCQQHQEQPLQIATAPPMVQKEQPMTMVMMAEQQMLSQTGQLQQQGTPSAQMYYQLPQQPQEWNKNS